MKNFIIKYFPGFSGLIGLLVVLVLINIFNWGMSNLMGDDIVKHDGVCVVGEYNTETKTGSLTCGDFKLESGAEKIKNFVSLAYVEQKPIICKIEVHEYTDEDTWNCFVEEEK